MPSLITVPLVLLWKKNPAASVFLADLGALLFDVKSSPSYSGRVRLSIKGIFPSHLQAGQYQLSVFVQKTFQRS
ncbi:hypothetical protein TNCV_5047161 [Trichonephila clavipes]|nr:hypothetical protein TNCV_5047161 [Trichonephila clavipes]